MKKALKIIGIILAVINAVKANNRKYYWTGKIATTAGAVYNFD